LPVGDNAHSLFWQQLIRWLLIDSFRQVAVTVPSPVLFDERRVVLTAEVHAKDYQPVSDAHVEAHIIGPGGMSASLDLTPVPDAPGSYQADWTASKAGSYLTEVIARRGNDQIGRDVLTFQRTDGVAEHFHTGQNRDLLEHLASQ